jgi:hypothetical protein
MQSKDDRAEAEFSQTTQMDLSELRQGAYANAKAAKREKQQR